MPYIAAEKTSSTSITIGFSVVKRSKTKKSFSGLFYLFRYSRITQETGAGCLSHRTVEDTLDLHGQTLTRIILFTFDLQGDLTTVCEDDGAGIPAHEKEMIFTYGHGKNTGIGLFLAKEILSVTGLAIRECGLETKGSRFEVFVLEGQWRVRE